MNWVNQLAPQGKLCVCINLGNALLAQLDPESHKPQGLSVEIAESFALHHGLELEMQMVQTAKESVAAVANKSADIGFFAIDPARATDVSFTKAYVYIDACYLAHEERRIQSLQAVDQSGVRIVVGLGSAYDLFLSRHIQHAELVRAPSTQDVIPVFLAETYEVAAGLQHALTQEAKKHPQLKVLMPPFMAIAQALGCHPSHSEEVKTGLQTFVENQMPSIAASIARQGLSGVRAAFDQNA
jgi:polar amino acid transport system substrate-binding protein